jgi:hypothetical protein
VERIVSRIRLPPPPLYPSKISLSFEDCHTACHTGTTNDDLAAGAKLLEGERHQAGPKPRTPRARKKGST